jgi:hypothetical protein
MSSLQVAREQALGVQIALKKSYEAARIVGYSTKVLKNDEDVEYEDLDPEILNEENGSKFPSIWINVTYKDGDREALEAELDKLAQDFDLEST